MNINKYRKIIELMNKINSSINFQTLLSNIIDSAKDVLSCEGASLLLHDVENDELIFDIVISDKGEIIRGRRLKIGEGIAGHVAVTRKGLIVNDVTKDTRFFSAIDLISGFVTRNIVAVPVMIKDKFIGVLEAVNSSDGEPFDHEDVDSLENIADAAAIAINNHELMVNLRNRVNELTCIYDISQSIYFTFNMEDFLLKILDAVNRVIQAQRCSFMILDDSGKGVKYFVSTTRDSYRIELENTLMYQVIKTGDPLLVYNIDDNLNVSFSKGDKKKDYKSKSFICVPMKLRDRVIGVLNVTDKSMGSIFDSFDLRVLSTVATQVAETYENVLLEKHNIEMERLAKDLKIAADIQAHSFSVVPDNIKNTSVGAFTLPASIVSGDFFEINVYDEDTFSCSVGDVSGKGIPAAMYMNTIRNAHRFEALRVKEPVEFVEAVNRWAFRESHNGMFCTLFYCLVDGKNSSYTYCSAGHNAQLYYNGGKGSFDQLKIKGKPLGVIVESSWQTGEGKFGKGDMLIFYSDGLVGQHGEGEISNDDFLRIIKDNKDKQATEIAEAVKMAVYAKSPDGAPSDDCTLVVVKFT